MASPKSSKRKQKKSLNHKLITKFFTSLLLIIAGASILIYSSIQEIDWIKKSSTQTQKTQEIDTSRARPVKMYIPEMNRILYVSDGSVVGNRWSISETGVSYYTDSALPGDGNTVIYGHNTQDILGGLWRVQNQDYIYVILQNGEYKKYQVYERKEIKPTQVEILKSTEDSRLTIYTCSGFLDTARFVLSAKEV